MKVILNKSELVFRKGCNLIENKQYAAGGVIQDFEGTFISTDYTPIDLTKSFTYRFGNRLDSTYVGRCIFYDENKNPVAYFTMVVRSASDLRDKERVATASEIESWVTKGVKYVRGTFCNTGDNVGFWQDGVQTYKPDYMPE